LEDQIRIRPAHRKHERGLNLILSPFYDLEK